MPVALPSRLTERLADREPDQVEPRFGPPIHKLQVDFHRLVQLARPGQLVGQRGTSRRPGRLDPGGLLERGQALIGQTKAAIALCQHQVQPGHALGIGSQERAGRVDLRDRRRPLLTLNQDPGIEELDIPFSQPAVAEPVNVVSRLVLTFDLAQADQDVGQQVPQLWLGTGLDRFTQDRLGTVGVAVMQLEPGQRQREGRAPGSELQSLPKVIPRRCQVPLLLAHHGGREQHIGVIGIKLERLLDVPRVGFREELAAIPPAVQVGAGRLRVRLDHALD